MNVSPLNVTTVATGFAALQTAYGRFFTARNIWVTNNADNINQESWKHSDGNIVVMSGYRRPAHRNPAFGRKNSLGPNVTSNTPSAWLRRERRIAGTVLALLTARLNTPTQ